MSFLDLATNIGIRIGQKAGQKVAPKIPEAINFVFPKENLPITTADFAPPSTAPEMIREAIGRSLFPTMPSARFPLERPFTTANILTRGIPSVAGVNFAKGIASAMTPETITKPKELLKGGFRALVGIGETPTFGESIVKAYQIKSPVMANLAAGIGSILEFEGLTGGLGTKIAAQVPKAIRLSAQKRFLATIKEGVKFQYGLTEEQADPVSKEFYRRYKIGEHNPYEIISKIKNIRRRFGLDPVGAEVLYADIIPGAGKIFTSKEIEIAGQILRGIKLEFPKDTLTKLPQAIAGLGTQKIAEYVLSQKKGFGKLASKPGMDITKNEIAQPIVEKAGGKFRAVSDVKNSIYPNDQTVYFDDTEGSTKTLPLSKLTPEAVKAKIGIPTPLKAEKAPVIADLKGEKGKDIGITPAKGEIDTKAIEKWINKNHKGYVSYDIDGDTLSVFKGRDNRLENFSIKQLIEDGEITLPKPTAKGIDSAFYENKLPEIDKAIQNQVNSMQKKGYDVETDKGGGDTDHTFITSQGEPLEFDEKDAEHRVLKSLLDKYDEYSQKRDFLVNKEIKTTKEGKVAKQPSFGAYWTPAQRAKVYKTGLQKGMTDRQIKALMKSIPEAPFEEALSSIKGVTGEPLVIPTGKKLVISEWNFPFKELSSFESAPISGLDPIRAANKVSGPNGPVRKFIVEPIRQADINQTKRTMSDFEIVDKTVKGVPLKKQIIKSALFDYIEKKEIKLSEANKAKFEKIDNKFREIFDSKFIEVNKARQFLGKNPIPYRQNYITHLQPLNILGEIFGGFQNIPDEVIRDLPDFIKPNSPFFRFALPRRGGPFEKDPVKAIKTYIKISNNVIENSPHIRQARELAKRLPPNARKYFEQYINEVAVGIKPKADQLFPNEILKLMAWSKQKTSKGAILGNISSMFNQVWTLPNITSSAGAINTTRAALKLTDPYYRAFAEKYSKTLQGRLFEIDFDPTLLSKAENVVGFMLQYVDSEMVRLSFLSGFEQAISEGKSFEDAIRFADDTAFKTQSGFKKSELPPAFRSKIGSSLLQFQNTLNNQFNFLVQDIGEKGGERTKWNIFKKSLMWLATFTVLNEVFRAIGIVGPIESALDLIPGVTLAKYGSSAAYQILTGGLAWVTARNEYDRTIALNKLRKAAYLYLPAGNQIRKSLEGVIAIYEGGIRDKKGKYKFRIQGGAEKTRAIMFGPSGTKAGRMYYQQKIKKQQQKTQPKGFLKFAMGLVETPAYAEENEKEGIASTYGWGEKLNKHTASGEVFNPDDLTAAMYDVPFGTKVEVTDLKTDKVITVRINDRGPNKRLNRTIDLSKGAWESLGYNKAGLTKVKIRILE